MTTPVRIAAAGAIATATAAALTLTAKAGGRWAVGRTEARLCTTAMWIDHGIIKMTGGIEDVVRAYEGEDAARHVRQVLEENAREGDEPLARRADSSAHD